MKHYRKLYRMTSLVLIMVLTIGSPLMALAYEEPSLSRNNNTVSDPYQAMYDADILYAEQLLKIVAEYETSYRPSEKFTANGEDEFREANIVLQSELSDTYYDTSEDSLTVNASEEKIAELRDLVEQGYIVDPETLRSYGFPDRTADELALLREELYTSRYIVRFEPGRSDEFMRQAEKSLGLIHELKITETGIMGFLTLNNGINPKDLAETLRKSGAETMIEYIQPDYTLSLDGIGDEDISDPTEPDQLEPADDQPEEVPDESPIIPADEEDPELIEIEDGAPV